MQRRPRAHNIKDQLRLRRQLRSALTRAEALLWLNLRNSNLAGKKFRRQHGIGPYIADFYCPESRVIVELDGAPHKNVLAAEYDALRTSYINGLGIRVIRFENRDVIEHLDWVLGVIKEALTNTTPSARR